MVFLYVYCKYTIILYDFNYNPGFREILFRLLKSISLCRKRIELSAAVDDLQSAFLQLPHCLINDPHLIL
jgi:hypothetical protein